MTSASSKQRVGIEVDQQDTEADNELLKLRKLLLGPDYDKAIHDYISREKDLERVSDVLSEAIKLCTKDDPALGRALAPVLNKAIHESITNNPSRITNAIFPIMGPAIRKAVSAALMDMVQSLNRVLEQSLSFKGIVWRIKAMRAGIPYGQYVMSQTLRYVVEQVLLVHRETGLLLHSVVDGRANAKDPELVSSMLTAIQDFVSDSFETQAESQLDRIQMGDLTLHLIAGPFAVLAVAVRGSIGANALNTVNDVFDSIHRRYAQELENFNGDRDIFVTVEDDLRSCLLSEKIEPVSQKENKPWLAIAVLSMLALIVGYESYWNVQYSQEESRVFEAINSETDYVLVSSKVDEKTIHAEFLRAPNAITLAQLEAKIQPRFHALKFSAQDVTFGYVDVNKLNALPDPNTPISLAERFKELVAETQSISILFEEKSAVILESSQASLSKLITRLKELQIVADQIGKGSLQIMVMGFADKHGTDYGNVNVSQSRADLVKSILVNNAVDEESLVAWGLGYRDTLIREDQAQRRVSVHISGAQLDIDAKPFIK